MIDLRTAMRTNGASPGEPGTFAQTARTPPCRIEAAPDTEFVFRAQARFGAATTRRPGDDRDVQSP